MVSQASAISTPLVSVVTPAYNEEEHLSQSIESVLGQTYPNWEYTIVNNRSSDRTLEIAQAYAAKDPRIQVCTNDTFVPALVNINKAFRQLSTQSKYCKMVLADDWIFPECLERMVAVMEQFPSVGIVGAYGYANADVRWVGLPFPSYCISGREICRQRLLGGPYIFGSPTSVLFRSALVRGRDPFYNESNVAADSEACFELLKECDFGFIHQVLTFSRDDRPNSRLKEARELNAAAHGILHEMLAYGPYYLSPEEYKECLGQTISRYYDFLAVSLLQRRNREFWRYHKARMTQEGIKFSRIRLGRSFARRLANRLLATFRTSQGKYQWGL